MKISAAGLICRSVHLGRRGFLGAASLGRSILPPVWNAIVYVARLAANGALWLWVKAKGAGAAIKRLTPLKPLLAGMLAVVTLIIAANELELSRIQSRRQFETELYFRLIENLGHSNPVVTSASISQIRVVMTKAVPIEGQQPWEGIVALMNVHEHATERLFHQDLQRLVRDLLKGNGLDARTASVNTAALLDLLCTLDASAWYQGIRTDAQTSSVECLQWMWQNAPNNPSSPDPAYTLLSFASLRHGSLAQKNLKDAYFEGTRFDNVDISESVADSAVFRGTTLRRVCFDKASLRGATFWRARIDSTTFEGTDLAGADFTEAVFGRGVSFRGALNADLAVGLPQRRR